MKLDGNKIAKLALNDKIDLFEYVSMASSRIRLVKNIVFIFSFTYLILNTILYFYSLVSIGILLVIDAFVTFIIVVYLIFNIYKQREYKYIIDCCLKDENFVDYYSINK